MAADSRVLIRRARYGEPSLAAAVEEAFDSAALEVRSRKVLVKPNLLSAHPPEAGVTTHPEVVSATIEALRKRGAAEILVGDNSGTRHYGDNERVAAAAGVLQAAGEHFVNLGRNPVRADLPTPGAGRVAVSGEIFDCDLVISLPKFKTHTLMLLTGAVKNSYGYLLGAHKVRLHRDMPDRESFASAVVDVFELRLPDLVILDAVTAMQGNGPSSRDVFEYGRILASTDSVALDAVMGRLMGLAPERAYTTAEAARRGLGQADLSKIEIDGELDPIEGFKLPVTASKPSRLLYRIVGFAGGLIVSEPEPDRRKCIRCRLCAEHCPAGAITFDPYPKIDRERCIRCYCCLEFCPRDAMRLSRRVRFLRRLG